MKNTNDKPTIVLGASPNPNRYSYLTTSLLKDLGFTVFPFGNKKGDIKGVSIHTDLFFPENLHTVTLYLNSARQKPFYDYIIKLKPQRIIFNPGAENDELFELASNHGIECIEACTLVMLRTRLF